MTIANVYSSMAVHMRNWMPEGIENNVTGITSFRENGRRNSFISV